MAGGAPKGNTNATKNKAWSDAIRKHAIQNKCYDKAAKKLWEMAIGGDIAALKEAGDRTDGKAAISINEDSGGFNVFINKLVSAVEDAELEAPKLSLKDVKGQVISDQNSSK